MSVRQLHFNWNLYLKYTKKRLSNTAKFLTMSVTYYSSRNTKLHIIKGEKVTETDFKEISPVWTNKPMLQGEG